MPLPSLELETSGFDTMLGFMHQPDEPKSLSYWEEVGNPLILHNTHNMMQQISFWMLISQIGFVGVDWGADAACGCHRGYDSSMPRRQWHSRALYGQSMALAIGGGETIVRRVE